jgi:phosphate transport system protein
LKTRLEFEKELEELKHILLKMGGLVEESIDNTMLALKTQDDILCRKIFKDDDKIDDLEQKIERFCLKLIAKQHPLAKDLRLISTTLKIITDLERIADHSSDIAEITLRMIDEKYYKPLIDVPKMAKYSKSMVNKAIDSYIRQDIPLAMEVCSTDDYVDDLFYKIILELVNFMKNDKKVIEQSINFMFIAKYLERMGDHATNIAEWVVYCVTGKHEHLAKYLHKDDEKNNPFIQDILDKSD